jgi:predicted membrane protein
MNDNGLIILCLLGYALARFRENLHCRNLLETLGTCVSQCQRR